MSAKSPFFQNVKPALDKFLLSSTRENLKQLENQLYVFNWMELKIVHVHVLLPLVLKMEELEGKDQELRTGLLTCIRLVVENIFLSEVKGLCTIITVALKQVRDFTKATFLPDLSEEIKMEVVLCISQALERSTSDVLEQFYTKPFVTLIGNTLLMLVDLIELEKYRKLRLKAMECLMTVFYVQEKAESTDVVLRCQVADTLFIYLPKILSVLFKISISDDKIGEALKFTAVKALGRILNIIYEDTNDPNFKKNYNSKEFKKLIEKANAVNNDAHTEILFNSKIKKENMKEYLTQMQNKGRSSQWFHETSVRLNTIFKQMNILCSDNSIKIRKEWARLCSKLLEKCTPHMKENFLILLENLIAMSEDSEESVRSIASDSLKTIRQCVSNNSLFDECADTLFETHSTKLIQILHRKDEHELLVELFFLKGFLRNVGTKKLYSLFSLISFMDSFCMALITTVDLNATRDLIIEEYALRKLRENDYNEFAKFHWRKFQYLQNNHVIDAAQDICRILGATSQVNRLAFDYLLEAFQTQQTRMNEILLIMMWIVTSENMEKNLQQQFMQTLLELILDDVHWHLALSPDAQTHLKVNKPSYWFVERANDLYGSEVEIRMQDYDSDDEEMGDADDQVGIADVQRNVLHTCIILDILGHCAKALSVKFKKHVFSSLHKVLLKAASSNTMVYNAAMFCLISMQNALGYNDPSEFIEAHTDYLSYHLNMLLRRSSESSAAVDILSVVLQLSSRNTLPYLESIFQTIYNECSKAQQEQHICAYLRVFNAFLVNVDRWHEQCIKEVDKTSSEDVDVDMDADNILNNWLQILEKQTEDFETETKMETENIENDEEMEEIKNDNGKEGGEEGGEDGGEGGEEGEEQNDIADEKMNTTTAVELPRHINIIKDIIQQTLKFISSTSQAHQILALECLINGVPLLKDYKDELLPLVHNIWQPLLEKFRLKDPLVLNRCFTLLNVLSTYARSFILKRSLDDVIPFLKIYLKETSTQSAAEHSKSQTQMYKLQLKLLQEFSNLIMSMKVDGKHLNNIAEVISLYLSQKQPKELQDCAVQFFFDLKSHNGPLIYLIAMKKCHLKDYKDNVNKIMSDYRVI